MFLNLENIQNSVKIKIISNLRLPLHLKFGENNEILEKPVINKVQLKLIYS
jgi:hypothetical protein